ncbi:MAG: glycosyl hydrolase 53 family protein, partial [Bacteroidota bacterium]
MKKNLLLLFIACAIFACKKSVTAPGNTNPPVTNSDFAKGADISWLTQMEGAGKKFYSSAGVEKDAMEILKDLGMNSARLRVWVDPADEWCNTADLVAKALRAKALGMKIMIDFHYSDSWADPGKQTKPLAWASQTFTELKQSVTTHTTAVLNTLKING